MTQGSSVTATQLIPGSGYEVCIMCIIVCHINQFICNLLLV